MGGTAGATQPNALTPGTNDLAASGATTQVAGPSSQIAHATGVDWNVPCYLQLLNGTVNPGAVFTINWWSKLVNIGTLPAAMFQMRKAGATVDWVNLSLGAFPFLTLTCYPDAEDTPPVQLQTCYIGTETLAIWNMYTIACDGMYMYLFINAQLQAIISVPGQSGSQGNADLYPGGKSGASDQMAQSICQLAIWRRLLNQGELFYLFASGNGTPWPF